MHFGNRFGSVIRLSPNLKYPNGVISNMNLTTVIFPDGSWPLTSRILKTGNVQSSPWKLAKLKGHVDGDTKNSINYQTVPLNIWPISFAGCGNLFCRQNWWWLVSVYLRNVHLRSQWQMQDRSPFSLVSIGLCLRLFFSRLLTSGLKWCLAKCPVGFQAGVSVICPLSRLSLLRTPLRKKNSCVEVPWIWPKLSTSFLGFRQPSSWIGWGCLGGAYSFGSGRCPKCRGPQSFVAQWEHASIPPRVCRRVMCGPFWRCWPLVLYFRNLSPRITPFAYADNWAWLSKTTKDNFDAWIKTLNMVAALRMIVSVSKSWIWVTNSKWIELLKCVNLLFPSQSESIPVLEHAKDLGEIIQYNKACFSRPLIERVDEAVFRIERLKNLPLNIEQKAIRIQTGIWSFGLYAADTHYVGMKHFSRLRRAAANALLGGFHHINPYIACIGISKYLMDPLLHVIVVALRSLRRLFSLDQNVAWLFVKLASSFDAKWAYGPASSLSNYLGKIGLK